MAPRTPAKAPPASSAEPADIRDAVKASVEAESADSKLWGFVPNWFRTSVGPLFLLLVPPYFVVLFWHIMVPLAGSCTALVDMVKENGPEYMIGIVPSPVDPEAWKYILGFG